MALMSKIEASKLSVGDSFEYPGSLFWDADVSKLNFAKDYEYIISRVLNRFANNLSWLEVIEKVYPLEMIKEICLNSKQIYAQEDILLLANRYGLNVEDFQKYSHP